MTTADALFLGFVLGGITVGVIMRYCWICEKREWEALWKDFRRNRP